MPWSLYEKSLKGKEKSSNQVNEITESNLIQAFGVTEDQMEKAALILNRSESTEKLGNSLAWLAKNYEDEKASDSMVEKEVFL